MRSASTGHWLQSHREGAQHFPGASRGSGEGLASSWTAAARGPAAAGGGGRVAGGGGGRVIALSGLPSPARTLPQAEVQKNKLKKAQCARVRKTILSPSFVPKSKTILVFFGIYFEPTKCFSVLKVLAPAGPPKWMRHSPVTPTGHHPIRPLL